MWFRGVFTGDIRCLQNAERKKTAESHAAEQAVKAKQLPEKTASVDKLTADIKQISTKKVMKSC